MSQRKILLLGKSGLLGSALFTELKSAGHQVFAPSREELDVLNYKLALKCVSEFGCKIIINCTGYNKVDECETNQRLAFQLNAEAVGNLAQVAQKTSAVLFHISSDYIFSGDKDGEYLEDDDPGPLNIYGRSKLEGEILVKKYTKDFCIIRTSWLFGPGGKNFITKILARWDSGEEELRVVSDERGRPTYSIDLAKAIRLAVEQNLRGIYHFCNEGIVSWFEYAQEIFETIGKAPRLLPVSALEYSLPAKRPKNSALSTKKIERELGIKIRHHQEALREYLQTLIT